MTPTEVLDAAVDAAPNDAFTRELALPVVRRVDALRFARASGDDRYLAAAPQGGELVLPRLLLASVMEWTEGPAEEHVRPDGLQAWDAPGAGKLPVDVVHGGQRITFLATVRTGDDLSLQREVVAARRRDGRRATAQITKRSTFHRDGRPVLVVDEDVFYLPSARSAAPPEVAATPSADSDEVPTRVVRPTPLQLLRFSIATGNAHRIHVDPVWAAGEGFAGHAVSSSLHGAHLLLTIEAALAAGELITAFSWRNLAPVAAGVELTCTGRVTARSAGGRRFEVTERGPDGTVHARGHAGVELAAGSTFFAEA